MKLRATLAMTAVLALGVVAAGCGSSSNDNTTTTSSLTKAEWIAKADAICRTGNQQVNQAGQQQFGNQKPTQAQIQQFASGTVIPNIESQVNQIKALGPPAEIEQQVNSLLATVQGDLDKAKADPSLLLNGSAFKDSNTEAQGLGLKVCGKS